jgi:hypothetical protein
MTDWGNVVRRLEKYEALVRYLRDLYESKERTLLRVNIELLAVAIAWPTNDGELQLGNLGNIVVLERDYCRMIRVLVRPSNQN